MECVSAIVFFLLSFVSISWCNEYYVLSQNKADCPDGSQCNDLNYYASQSEIYFTSDTTLTFLEGTHILNQDGPIIVSGVSNLTLRGLTPNTSTIEQHAATVIINCSRSNSGFLMNDFNDITLSGLSITDCGFRLPEKIKPLVISSYSASRYTWDFIVSFNASFSLLIFNGTNTIIDKFSVSDGIGYGLTAVNVFDIEMTSSSFSRNNFNCSTSIFQAGGNIRLAYVDASECPSHVSDTSLVSMKDVSITYGQNCGGNQLYDPRLFNAPRIGGGLSILGFSLNCSIVKEELYNVNIIGNVGDVGANLLILGYPLSMNITNLYCSNGTGTIGGSGITIVLSLTPPDNFNSELKIINSSFIGNTRPSGFSGSGAAFYLLTYSKRFYDQVLFKSCYFAKNIGASVVKIEKNNEFTPRSLKVNFDDVVMDRNGEFISRNLGVTIGILVLINCVGHATDLSVLNSPYTGIHMRGSSLTFTGENLIQNNSYTNGGGMILQGSGSITFEPPANVTFISNHADEYGGAIYIPVDTGDTYITSCFFNIKNLNTLDSYDIIINAINNTAGITGSFVNGGDLGICYIDDSAFLDSFSTFISFIRPPVSQNDYHFISSNPVAVVYCQENGDYSYSDRHITRPIKFFPGKLFTISVATISQNGGITPGSMNINIYNCSNIDTCFVVNSVSHPPDFIRATSNECTDVDFVIKGNEYTEILILELTSIVPIPYDLLSSLRITIESVDCPPGFSKREYCECNDYITSVGGTCDINSTTITTNGSVWISYDNTSNCTLYSSNCPNGFCIEKHVSFNIFEPDLQCRSGRTGRLCGVCADGYSLLLGSDECDHCPNNNFLSLLIVFSIAGILLVVLLIALNLTVSVGTINGLIFYANIVKINEDIFFPSDSSEPLILRQFISFLNLDFGLKTCFYNGMTAYAKAWLQFAFPLYIWFIMIVIMLLSSRFTKLSSLIGNNAVKVFATLLLLSYTKIIRAIGVTLSLTLLRCDTVELYVWKYDGAIAYGSSEHLILVTFSVLFLVCLVLPYTLILIGLPVIDRFFTLIRCQRCFLWLKPFTDAYSGPFKSTHQFWVGLLLIGRIILTIVSDVIDDNDPPIYLTIFFVIFLLFLALSLQGPYKSNYINILESWFLANLLGVYALGLRKDELGPVVGILMSVSFVLVTFIAIIVYHIYCVYHNPVVTTLKQYLEKRKADITNSSTTIPTMEDGDDASLSGSHRVPGRFSLIGSYRRATFSKFRESLLDDTL